MEEALQELKNLMNSLFIKDLKEEAKELKNNITSQFQGAVNDFTNDYQELVNKASKKVLEPQIKELDKKHDSVISEVTTLKTEQGKFFVELIEKNKNLESSLVGLSSKILTKIFFLEKFGKLCSEYESKNKELIQLISDLNKRTNSIISELNNVKNNQISSNNNIVEKFNNLEEKIQLVHTEFNDKIESINKNSQKYEQLFVEKSYRIISNSYIILSLGIVEILILLYILFR